MSIFTDSKCKICRRAGEKLFLKGEKCFSVKCPLVKKPYPPGIFGPVSRRRPPSEYGDQLKEKQKLRFAYGLREKQFANYVEKATKKRDIENTLQLIRFLESRLDNVVFKMGLAKSRSAARQLVSHGYIAINGRKTTIPSFGVKEGDLIQINPPKTAKPVFRDLDVTLKKHQPPSWIELDKNQKTAKIIAMPSLKETAGNIDLNKIIEFYTK
ncbi:MAG: 30S ribosomal protein S4 [Candidatus Niyogibacteria bacterium RIFCSPLOWO2_12_FULL_41_13]|uniref:Small ribosomal subunit protein uS4 n=1 Tax=Candidatus Niyogibacteria bacterium RIFCSPLOWO2_12_FULL_41_13 TaxID=1801726 RepID=A0A1G2F255_9BACT|nr:MAG: 30S ribosomal protein S4 [Candidatus Niyogibacteria bacterium RIFCSPLOWO2_12_FULL_41_13]